MDLFTVCDYETVYLGRCPQTHTALKDPYGHPRLLMDYLHRWSQLVQTLTTSLLVEQSVYEAVAGLDHFVHSILTQVHLTPF